MEHLGWWNPSSQPRVTEQDCGMPSSCQNCSSSLWAGVSPSALGASCVECLGPLSPRKCKSYDSPPLQPSAWNPLLRQKRIVWLSICGSSPHPHTYDLSAVLGLQLALCTTSEFHAYINIRVSTLWYPVHDLSGVTLVLPQYIWEQNLASWNSMICV